MTINDSLGPNPVMVVAHPDDEVLWGGGMLIQHGNRDWTVICCSIPTRDSVRAWKFFDVCEYLGAHARLLPAVESMPSDPLIRLSLLKLMGYSCIVTHNATGEYGHAHHKSVHDHIVANYPKKPKIFFGYGEDPDEHITLGPAGLVMKQDALNLYDHQSPLDQKPKCEALVDRYFGGDVTRLGVEGYRLW